MASQHIFFAFRVMFIAILLVLARLLLPEFAIGAKYHILFESLIAAVFVQMLRIGLQQRLKLQTRRLIAGGGMAAGLIMAKVLFHGVRLTAAGILFLYFGVVFLETLLPDEMDLSLVKR